MNASELFDLSGKVAVITGGAGSIGMAYGRALGEAGASVVLADVDEGAATKAADALKADGSGAIGVAVDVRDLASAQAMARAAVDAFGGIDILVNNAAIMRDLPQYGLSNMPGRRVGPGDRRQPPGPAAVHAGRAAVDDRAGRRPDHQRSLRRRVQPRRHLRHLQVRVAQPHRQPRERARTAGHQRERNRSRTRRRRERLRQPAPRTRPSDPRSRRGSRARSPDRRRTSWARCCCSARAPATGSTARPSASTAAGSCVSEWSTRPRV